MGMWYQFIAISLELPKLYHHPWLAADEDGVSHVLSHVL